MADEEESEAEVAITKASEKSVASVLDAVVANAAAGLDLKSYRFAAKGGLRSVVLTFG